MIKEEIFSLIQDVSNKNNLDHNLIMAIIKHESNFNPWAMRYEPMWRYFYFERQFSDKLLITYDTERMLQSFSFGLGQIMGSVARELGFSDHLTKLLEPKTNIIYTCIKIKSLFYKYNSETDVIASYNMGSPRKTAGGMYENQKNYVDPICETLRIYRQLK